VRFRLATELPDFPRLARTFFVRRNINSLEIMFSTKRYAQELRAERR